MPEVHQEHDRRHPQLARHARLHYDRRRERWLLLLPERVLMPDDIAMDILRLCDGTHSLDEIVDRLAGQYGERREVIANDVEELLQGLKARGVVQQ